MGKKSKILFWIIALLTSAALYIMPQMVQSSIPSVYYITPTQKTYENVVNCTGTVQSAQVKTLYTDSTLVAESIHVSVGEKVNEGDLLLSVDQEKTRQIALSPLFILQEFAEGASLSATDTSNWLSLASSFGLNATVNGNTASEQDFEKILQDVGVLNYNESVGVFASGTSAYIHAPITGIVTDLSAYPGVPLTAGKSILTIADDSAYKVTAQVSESDIAMVSVGNAATIRGVGFSGSIYSGEVVNISPTARKALNGTSTETVVDVEIQIFNPDDRLKAGFTAKVEIIGGEDYDLLTVPYEAVRQDENNSEYVYVYENGKIQKALVTTGKELTSEVQILDGINQDSIVIYNPSDITKEGSMIHIKGRADVN